MAVDTANKRASVSGDMLPFPDGTIDQGDRQHTAGDYRGILSIILNLHNAQMKLLKDMPQMKLLKDMPQMKLIN